MSKRLERLRALTDAWSEEARQASAEVRAAHKGDKFLKKKYRKGKVGSGKGGAVKAIAGPLGYAGTGSYEGFGGYQDRDPDGRRT